MSTETTEAAKAPEVNNLAPTDADAPPNFQIDSEAFIAASPEGYNTDGAKNLLAKHKDMHSLVSSAMEAEKSFSSRMPVPDLNDPAKMSEVYARMGVPETATGYEYSEGIKFTSEEAKGSMSELFKGLDISTKQANGLLEWYQGNSETESIGYTQSIADGLGTTESFLQDESGGLKGSKAYGDYWNVASSAMAAQGIDIGSDDNAELMGSDVGRKMIKFAYQFGQAARPGSIPGITSQESTVASLEGRMNSLYKEMSTTSWNNQKQAELNSIKQQMTQARGR